MTASPYSLPGALAGYLQAPNNPECEARLKGAMQAERREGWLRRFDPAQQELAGDAWLWMERALAADGEARADLAAVLQTIMDRLVAARRRAAARKNDLSGRYRRSEPPANAWWLDL